MSTTVERVLNESGKEKSIGHVLGTGENVVVLNTVEVCKEDKIKKIQEYAVSRGIKGDLFIPHIMYLFASNIFQIKKKRDRNLIAIEAYFGKDDIDLTWRVFDGKLNQVSLQQQNIQVIDFLYTACKAK